MLKVKFEAASPEEFQKMLVHFADSHAMVAELKQRGVFSLAKPLEYPPSAEYQPRSLDSPEKPKPMESKLVEPQSISPAGVEYTPAKRRPGRPPGSGKKEPGVGFVSQEDWDASEAVEKQDVLKPITKDDVIIALNAYANANGGKKEAAVKKIVAFCKSDKLADIPVEKYGEFIESLQG